MAKLFTKTTEDTKRLINHMSASSVFCKCRTSSPWVATGKMLQEFIFQNPTCTKANAVHEGKEIQSAFHTTSSLWVATGKMLQEFIFQKPTCTKANAVHEGKENEVLHILTPLTNQHGGFSPFMFGLLAGVTVLSGLMQHWAKDELKRIEERRAQMVEEKAADVKRAVENMILTENVDSEESYNRFFSLDSLRGSLTNSTGNTRSGANVQIQEIDGENKFGERGKRLYVTASDDAFTRQQVEEAGAEAGDLEDVVVIDTSEIRQKQIESAKEKLEMKASQLYRYYASNGYKFPTSGEYSSFNDVTGIKDPWGQDFKYEKKTHKKAILSFTTPWGYTFKKALSTE